MPPRRQKGVKPLKEYNQPINVLQANRVTNPEYQNTLKEVSSQLDVSIPVGVAGIRSLFDSDENSQPVASTSAAADSTDALGTAALYDELDSFRQRWKRELDQTKSKDTNTRQASSSKCDSTSNKEAQSQTYHSPAVRECQARVEKKSDIDSYEQAKKLFLLAVSLEQDDLHHESIRYYKQAMHLCPNIERQIFKEQCEANALANANLEKENQKSSNVNRSATLTDCKQPDESLSLLTKITQNLESDNRTDERYTYCRPTTRQRKDCLHISDLPRELILLICRYVVGQELDLASLESVGLVCRGFFLLSRDQSLWSTICRSVWDGDNEDASETRISESPKKPIDWRSVFIKRPRINYDGVYISRTRYIRQGDVGFQDLTYRPFHVVRYYRYLRFLPEHRVLILTTNEEPEKIVPIFRHATQARQFSSELSILEGTYEFIGANLISIVAEKDCRAALNMSSTNHRRQAQFEWSRQTPLSQKFNMKFELRTVESKPYRNNVLKWLEYTILTRLETGQEITSFDLNPDTFPSLIFSRVKRFNLRVTRPLAISQ